MQVSVTIFSLSLSRSSLSMTAPTWNGCTDHWKSEFVFQSLQSALLIAHRDSGIASWTFHLTRLCAFLSLATVAVAFMYTFLSTFHICTLSFHVLCFFPTLSHSTTLAHSAFAHSTTFAHSTFQIRPTGIRQFLSSRFVFCVQHVSHKTPLLQLLS